MTVKELYEKTALLGFESSLDSTEGFFHAANRAILQVNSLRPAIRSFTINHRNLENALSEDTFCPVDKKEDLCFEAYNARAYYFEADGNGTAIIEAYTGNTWTALEEISLSSARKYKAYKGFIKDGDSFIDDLVRLRFTGDYIYSVKNVAVYKHIYSDSENDIPAYEPYVKYDLTKLLDDFLVIAQPPILEGEEKVYLCQGYEIEGKGVLSVSTRFNGLVKIMYRHKPTKLVYAFSPVEDDTVIDLDEELCELLPPLVASFVWAEDEAELANYYMNIYREWAARLVALEEDHSAVTIKNTNGW